MYLRFETSLDFPEIARTLCKDLSEDLIGWDSENVYEWMYVDLPQLEFSLNVSRDHGWSDIEDSLLDQLDDNQLRQIVQPGPVYVMGWIRYTSDYVAELPDSLPQFIADRLSVEVSVFNRRLNVDIPDEEPIKIVSPRL